MKNQPKKCRQLQDVIESLKASFGEAEVPKGDTYSSTESSRN